MIAFIIEFVIELIVLISLVVASYFAIVKFSFEFVLFSWILITFVILLWNRFFNEKRVPKNRLGEQAESWPIDLSRSFFPVLLIVFLLRSFVAEPFQIPSSSMLPSLEIGDFILVNKFSYGVRLPILHKKVLPKDEPQRGDVMVFRYPKDNKTNFIKRVIGLPGDTIEYRFKRLYINGQLIDIEQIGHYSALNSHGRRSEVKRFEESLPERKHDILLDPNPEVGRPIKKTWVVPKGYYFVMGDNRDSSLDSRYWNFSKDKNVSFVPDENIVGKAFIVWFNWNRVKGGGFNQSLLNPDRFNLDRIGTKI